LHFALFTKWENTHPLQGGIFRLKYRRDRRPTFPLEPVWRFYPRLAWDLGRKGVASSERKHEHVGEDVRLRRCLRAADGLAHGRLRSV
jgi:hypothetical protein